MQRARDRVGWAAVAMVAVFALSGGAWATPFDGGRGRTRRPGEQGGPLTLTLEGAVDLALKIHPALRASEAEVDAARQKRRQVKAAWWPQAGLEASYYFRGPLLKLKIDEEVAPGFNVSLTQKLGSYHNVTAGVQAGWRAWDWGVRGLLGRAADAGIRSARAGRRDVAAKLAYGVRTGFLALLLYRELERIAQNGVKQAEAHYREERLKLEGGTGNRLNVAQTAMTLARRKADRVAVRQQIRRIRVTLALLCGLAKPQAFRASGDLKALSGLPVPRISRTTLRRVPAVRQAMEGSRAFDFRAAATLRSRWPTLEVVGGAALVYPKNFFEKEWGPAYQAGVVLRWHFWDGLLKNRQADEAIATARRLRRLGDAAMQQAQQRYAEAVAALRTADAELKAAQGTLKAAMVYLNAAETAVKGGLGRTLELTDAQTAVLSAQAAIQKGYFDRAMARAQVLWALGVARRGELRQRRYP